MIISMKNMLADRGLAPIAADRVIRTFEETGRTVPPNPAIDKQRFKPMVLEQFDQAAAAPPA